MKRAIMLALGTVAILACGSSDNSSGDVAIHPGELYSGFEDGTTTTFSVPATAINVADKTAVKWTVGDSSIADVTTEDPQPGDAPQKSTHHAIVTTKKAGKTTLRATVGGTKVEIPLTVTSYSAGSSELGNDLYQVDNPGATQGGATDYVHGLGCIGCHGAKGGPRHSPSEIGGYPDAAILETIATGVKPNGDVIQVANGNHKFSLDDKQKEAILARLRSLAPIDFPQ